MTAEVALKLGAAVGRHFRKNQDVHRVVIGKDTRLSGYMIENALTAGFTSVGMDVFLLGPVPTPGVGYLTRSMRADVGVMISASHNPASDNGIKFFDPKGFKLSHEAEADIQKIMQKGPVLANHARIGRVKRIDDALGRYVERTKRIFPRHLKPRGLRIVVDCANGAAYQAAPTILWELGAEVVSIGVKPNGHNINKGCGSTDCTAVVEKLLKVGAHLGICLDGDADRAILVDEKGQIIDGDRILGVLALDWHRRGLLRGGAVVGTAMSNLGLEQCLNAQGIALKRTLVGDRYVAETMRQDGLNLGGESSGHIVMADHATTGDGLLAALQFLAIMLEADQPASALTSAMPMVPQQLRNVSMNSAMVRPDTKQIDQITTPAQKRLGAKGRILVRPSGTEPLMRIMVECSDSKLLAQVLDEVEGQVKSRWG